MDPFEAAYLAASPVFGATTVESARAVSVVTTAALAVESVAVESATASGVFDEHAAVNRTVAKRILRIFVILHIVCTTVRQECLTHMAGVGVEPTTSWL